MAGRWGSALTINGQSVTVLRVCPGERIRPHLLNSAKGRVFATDCSDLDAQVTTVALSVSNDSPRIHTHLHGMFFRLIARNGVPSGETWFCDTVLIHPHVMPSVQHLEWTTRASAPATSQSAVPP